MGVGARMEPFLLEAEASHHAAEPCRLRMYDLSALRLSATKMCTTEREETLMHIWSYDPRPKRTVSTILCSKDSVTAAVQVARGERVFDFARQGQHRPIRLYATRQIR